MKLSPQDGQLYYQLWLPLLDFVNRKYGVKKHLKKMAGAESLEPNEIKTVSDKLFDHVSVITESYDPVGKYTRWMCRMFSV